MVSLLFLTMGHMQSSPVIVYKVLQGEKLCEVSVNNSLWSVKIIYSFLKKKFNKFFAGLFIKEAA